MTSTENEMTVDAYRISEASREDKFINTLPDPYIHANPDDTGQERVYARGFEWLGAIDTQTGSDLRARTIHRLKIMGAGASLGLLSGHIYSVYRGIWSLQFYTRNAIAGTSFGLALSLPVISIPILSRMGSHKHAFKGTQTDTETSLSLNEKKLNWKENKIIQTALHGSVFGALIGHLHKGPSLIPTYALVGCFFYCGVVGFWFECLKPIYYYHILKWPGYEPPWWWPYQPLRAIELYDAEIERERLNVIYPEDLVYWEAKEGDDMHVQGELSRLEIERQFVHDSQVNERKHLNEKMKSPLISKIRVEI